MNIVIDNEFKNLIPPLTPEEFAGLKQSLMSEGCRDPLVLWGNILIDGHNEIDGITYPFNLACRNGRIIRLYPYEKMKHIAYISENESEQLKELSTRNYDYE